MSKSEISKGKWSLGRQLGTVVTDSDEGFPPSYQGDSHKYYGGYLIAESVGKPADAKLIAAAPEMLEALTKIVEGWDTPANQSISDWLSNIIQRAEDAIRKATE